jgi:uncharacterized Zn finger protein
MVAEIYMEILKQCEKCGNSVLYNDTEQAPVVSCPICGMRYYVPDSMIENIIISLEPKMSKKEVKQLEVELAREGRLI